MTWEHFRPIPGINQIVRHTAGHEVREKAAENSRNFCIDAANGAVSATITDGQVEFSTRRASAA